MNKKLYSSFLVLFFLCAWQVVSFAQAQENTNFAATDNQRVKENAIPPLPVMLNTGNPETDAAVYSAKKEKWIEDVLILYSGRITPEQINKMRELLRKENLEDVMKGKVLLTE